MDEYVYEEKQVGNLTVKVVLEMGGGIESPREWDPSSTFYTAHRSYRSPDPYDGDLWEHLAREFDITYYYRAQKYSEYETDPGAILAAMDKKAIVLPVFMYEHGNVAYRATEGGNPFHCPWDSGQVGIIYRTLEAVRKEYNVTRVSSKLRAKIIERLKKEVEVYSAWASGEVYGYVVENEDGDQVDSCWGFIGEAGYCLEEGISSAKVHIAYEQMLRRERLKELIKNKVPLDLRPHLLKEVRV